MTGTYAETSRFIDYYAILGLAFGAPRARVRTAWRKKAKAHHPDTATDSATSEMFPMLRAAYEVLSNEKTRAIYDSEYAHRLLGARPDQRLPVVPSGRIRYAMNMADLARSGLLQSKFRYRDRLFHMKHNIEARLTARERETGAILSIELPARKPCDACADEAPRWMCPVCGGSRWAVKSQPVLMTLPAGSKPGDRIEVDLSRMRPGRLTHFTLKKFIIKVA